MSNITVIDQTLPDFLQSSGISELTKSLMGDAGTKRIVPKNGIFRKEIGGKEMGKVKGDLNVIIVNSSPKVGRIFYAKQWSPDAEPTAPDCFSNNGQTPDAGSANKQADRCDDCQQNIKGSGMGNSKACRYSRRIAVLLEDDFGTPLEGDVYQMNLASKSLFGESPSENTHMFENYVKYLGNNGKSLDWYITQMSFNEDNDNQSLLFTPVEHIKRNHYDVITKVGNTPAVQKMITMTPYKAQTGNTPKLTQDKVTGTNPEDTSEMVYAVSKGKGRTVEVEDVAEPVKREGKKAEPAPAKRELDAVLKAWGDEE
jgi:hypothetical protein